ncbi:MAG: Helicase associated domain protein [Holophagaceae bacterium]
MKPTHDQLASVLKTGIFNQPYTSFKDLEKKISELGKINTLAMGHAFEVFVEAYLCTQADKQVQEFFQVGHIPKQWRDRLNLSTGPAGIDGLYIDRAGDPVVFQAKFYTGRPSITYSIAQSFLGMSNQCRKRFIISNANNMVDLVKQRNVSSILGFQFDKLTPDDFKAIHHFLHQTRYQPQPYRPDPHQAQAVRQVMKTFKTEHRTQAIMACGTGKTFAALWVAEALKPQTVLVLVPSIALLSQTLKAWSKATSWGERFTYMAVCSDDTVGQQEDDLVLRASDLDFPTSTDPNEIKRFMRSSSSNVRIIFSTYQSSPMVAKAMKGQTFDLGIFDEAHKTTGSKKTHFTEAHQDKFIAIQKRLYMTATPRIYKIHKRNKDGDFDVLSMDDPEIYGREAYKLSFGEAARNNIICNYKIVITTIDPRRLDPKLLPISKTLVQKEHLPSDWVAKSAALAQAIKETKAHRIITFHSRVKLAHAFASQGPQGIQTHLQGFETFHVSGHDSASKRELDIEDFKRAPKGLITNARCLTEGVDVPTVDMVAFMDPKKSTIDIAQAIGRAMRKPRGTSSKKIGYIFIPLLVESTKGKLTESSIEETDYKAIADVINAMQELDEDLKDIIRDIRYQTGLTGRFNPRRLQEKIAFTGNLNELSLKVIEKAVLNEVVNRVGASWDKIYGSLVLFIKNHERYPVRNGGAPNERFLSRWVTKQRGKYKNNQLASKRVDLLEDLYNWSWDPFADAWAENINKYKQFVARWNRLPKNRDRRGARPIDELILARWINGVRSRKRKFLTQAQIDEIEALPMWTWDPIADKWEQYITAYTKFYSRYKRMPKNTGDTKEKRLAKFLNHHRIYFKRGVLPNDKIVELQTLPGWTWDPFSERWDQNFQQLEAYVNKHQNYPTHDSSSLGGWISKQRTAYKRKKLSPDQIRRLEGLPHWSWDPLSDQWNTNFQQLEAYVNKHQNYPTHDSSSLGGWISKQRTAYKRKQLSPDQIHRLEGLPNWSWDPLVDLWNENFQRLQVYVKEHRSYPTQQSGSLGKWVSNQRTAYKRKQLSPDQIRRLEGLPGWSWGQKKTKT